MKKFRLVITGNPGVGKHTCAKVIAKKLGAEVIDINAVAIDHGAISEQTERGLDVDVRKLTSILAGMLKSKKDLIVVGHLAPYVVKRGDIDVAAVLRRSPYELEKTLEKRGYEYAKVRENVSSEILGVSLYDSIKTFGKAKVAEFDTTGETPLQTANAIISVLLRKSPRRSGTVDWLALVSERDDIQKFFEYS
ncbi:MAG TPA: adenylate kinase family protein [Nitrososphaera sp.]|nr:adenylate kinase family protein [Nitrososphaera sp.]